MHMFSIYLMVLTASVSATGWNIYQRAIGSALPESICRWAREQERVILRDGVPLDAAQMADARCIGVRHPERVRLLRVNSVPVPAEATALFGDSTVGLTLRYGIFIRADSWDDRQLLAHELTHTRQYEQRGSIESFLRAYLPELPTYPTGPLETEAETTAQRIARAAG